jgi:dolichol-phosphate mannosyltransferase/undecaprenyl-phosphate 4-deoxy-4-formamido-L-arabinose transferase
MSPKSKTPVYSVVVPVYNSTDSLIELVDRIEAVFAEQVPDAYEIVMVDDGSPNAGSWACISELAKTHKSVRGIQLMRNFGKPSAILCGMSEARGDYIITMDDDLQHRPEDIPVLLAAREHDVVMGAFRNRQHSSSVRSSSRIKGWFDYKLIGKPRHIANSPFRMLKAEVVKAFSGIRTPYPFIPALIFHVTNDVVNVEIDHDARKFGQTGYSWRKRFGQFLRLLINNSSFLLQLVAGVGSVMALISIVYAAYLVVHTLVLRTSVAGWASLMVVTLFIGGLVLLSLGVIGEYLIRIINGTEQRPAYVMRGQVGNE